MVFFVRGTMPLCVCVQTVVFMGDVASLHVCVSTDGGVCGLVLCLSGYGTQGGNRLGPGPLHAQGDSQPFKTSFTTCPPYLVLVLASRVCRAL